jgi:ADP-ribose pyrophosphatase YjhB (NUDIX family)
MPIFDVFQEGLRRGSEKLSHDKEKAYAYVEHPTEGWRVYLRTAMFVHMDGVPFQEDKFLVFRSSKKGAKNIWEPPKGQMEGKDLLRKSERPLLELLATSVRRETAEEAHIEEFSRLRYTGLVFQSQEESYPRNWFFQYHIFQGFIRSNTLLSVFNWFAWYREHPKAYRRLSRDKKETDAVAWFSPMGTRLNPRWCPTIVFTYLKEYYERQH